jgi:hypothetical protein
MQEMLLVVMTCGKYIIPARALSKYQHDKKKQLAYTFFFPYTETIMTILEIPHPQSMNHGTQLLPVYGWVNPRGIFTTADQTTLLPPGIESVLSD